jgi:hypothetical protein
MRSASAAFPPCKFRFHIECRTIERYAVCLFQFVKNAEKTVIDDSLETWQDLRQIVLTRSYEVRDWCKAFGCTKEELHDAVKAVGTSAQKVREYLKR